jgi:hypothetical protein
MRGPAFRWAFAGAMIFMVLFCSLLSSSPNLHEAIHPDANNEHHHCAITIFAHGHADLTVGNPILGSPVFREFQISAVFPRAILPSTDYLLLPGRAPPVLAS